MLRSSFAWKFASGIAAVAVLVSLTVALGRDARERNLVLLSDADLTKVTGDLPTVVCRSQKLCSTAFSLGSTQCAKCQAEVARYVCCNNTKTTNTTCEYTGALECWNDILLVGAIQGVPGTCGTCTSPSFAIGGNCTTIQQANGDMCPP